MSQKRSPSNLMARECIVTALLQLIREKPLSAITISELAERAGVSRVTFYRNYASKEAVFTTQLAEFFAMYESDDQGAERKGIYYDQAHMSHCFHYLYQYRAFMDGLLYCGFGDLFLRRLTAYVRRKWAADPADGAEQYRLAAFSGMLYNIYTAWVRRDCRESPDELAKIVEAVWRG